MLKLNLINLFNPFNDLISYSAILLISYLLNQKFNKSEKPFQLQNELTNSDKIWNIKMEKILSEKFNTSEGLEVVRSTYYQ
jgi:hypothetical protein